MTDSFHLAVATLMRSYFWPGGMYSMNIIPSIAQPSKLEELVADFLADVRACTGESHCVKHSCAQLDKLIKEHLPEALVSPVASIRTRARIVYAC